MTEQEKLIIEKHVRINDLLSYALDVNEMKFFDNDSDEMLDDKIEVLEAIKAGKTISEIPKFYDVLELMPKEGIWD